MYEIRVFSFPSCLRRFVCKKSLTSLDVNLKKIANLLPCEIANVESQDFVMKISKGPP